MELQINVKKVDKERQVVYGEVYPPLLPDSEGEFMSPDEIIDMAHRFLVKGALHNVDTNHNNILNGSVVVESWVEQNEDGIYLYGAWVVGVHVPEEEVWADIMEGRINGFSLEAKINRIPRTIEIEVPEVIEGETQVNDGHKHKYRVKFAEDGTYLGGETDLMPDSNGVLHKHKILRGTITAQARGHTHRYSFADVLETGLEIVDEYEED